MSLFYLKHLKDFNIEYTEPTVCFLESYIKSVRSSNKILPFLEIAIVLGVNTQTINNNGITYHILTTGLITKIGPAIPTELTYLRAARINNVFI